MIRSIQLGYFKKLDHLIFFLKKMNLNERIFLQLIEKLLEQIESSKDLEVLEASNTIYRLIKDKKSILADQVNTFGLKIKFEITDTEDGTSGEMMKKCDNWGIDDGFYPPDQMCREVTIIVDRADFFKKPIRKHNGYIYSVGEFLYVMTENLGSRHTKNARTNKERILIDITTKFEEVPVFIHQIRSIGHVVIDALESLESELLNKQRLET